MVGAIDIHCHVLPGVDDGAKNIDESLEMLSIMHDEGIRTVILTPHYHGGRMEPDAGKIRDRYDKLCAEAAQNEKLKDMGLYLGCEIYYYPSVTDWLDEGRVFSMADSSYVLLEFGFTMEKRMIAEGVSTIVNSGYVPIIAHIERYEHLVGDLAQVDGLIEKGALVQINSECLYARHRVSSFAKKLLKEKMVHFLATDAHDTYDRAPALSDAAYYIAKHYGKDYCKSLIFDNPVKVLKNEYISR